MSIKGEEISGAQQRKVRMGMVGGGPGAFIGEVHRKTARMDGLAEIVAGAFDIDPAKSLQMGAQLGLDSSRVYKNYQDMIEGEKKLPADQRIDFVAVCTPNNWHFPIAKAFLEAGFHVMCEKPVTLNLKEAHELEQIVKKSGQVFGLMHNYTGYPMVKLARDMVRQGDLGKVLKIVVQYAQGWLARPIEREGQMQASWRTDPKQSGAAGCMGDIGTHAENLAEYVTGLQITEMCADLSTFIEGRKLDDDGNVLLHFDQGAKGLLHASQISIGQENGLAIWIYGQQRSLEWRQEHPNYLYVYDLEGPLQTWRRGNPYVADKSPAAGRATRIPAGHPEAFLEAFANNYRNFIDTIKAQLAGRKPTELEADFPGIREGVRGMAFIETVVASGQSADKWVKMKT